MTSVKCVVCLKPTLLACLLNHFKSSSSLQAFIMHNGLNYACFTCRANELSRDTLSMNVSGNNSNGGIPCSDVQNTLIKMEAKISDILNQFQTKNSSSINVNHGSIPDNTPSLLSQTSISALMNNKTYAQVASQVASADIVKAVHEAITDGLKKRRSDDKADVSVMVFGLRESNKDMSNVSKLLNYSIHSIMNIQRIGKYITSDVPTGDEKTIKIRPLRVKLRCKEDKDWVLRNARELERAYRQPNVRIAKCLKTDESAKIKLLRNKCGELNNKNPALPNGKMQFVVIDGRIMKRHLYFISLIAHLIKRLTT